MVDRRRNSVSLGIDIPGINKLAANEESSNGGTRQNHKVYFEIPKSNIYLHLYIVALSEVWGINFHYLNMTLALWGLLRYCLVILLTIENHCLPPSSSHTYIAFLIFKFIDYYYNVLCPTDPNFNRQISHFDCFSCVVWRAALDAGLRHIFAP